jgi:hypothetical protein
MVEEIGRVCPRHDAKGACFGYGDRAQGLPPAI